MKSGGTADAAWAHDPQPPPPRVHVPPSVTFSALLDALYVQRFTGKVVLHFQRGRPRLYEQGSGPRLRLSD